LRGEGRERVIELISKGLIPAKDLRKKSTHVKQLLRNSSGNKKEAS